MGSKSGLFQVSKTSTGEYPYEVAGEHHMFPLHISELRQSPDRAFDGPSKY